MQKEGEPGDEANVCLPILLIPMIFDLQWSYVQKEGELEDEATPNLPTVFCWFPCLSLAISCHYLHDDMCSLTLSQMRMRRLFRSASLQIITRAFLCRS